MTAANTAVAPRGARAGANHDVLIMEAGGGVRATRSWNRHPGARSDTDGYLSCAVDSPENPLGKSSASMFGGVA
jgi:hypothetical protein